MSRTELYKANERGDVSLWTEFQNSYRGAFLIWHEMHNKYIGDNFTLLDDMKPTWDLAKRGDVKLSHKIVMMSTFDNAAVRRKNFPDLVEAYREYAKDFPDNERVLTYANTIEKAKKNITALLWNQTSVCENPWYVIYKYNSRTGEGMRRPYNIKKDRKHWFIFK